MAWATTFGLLEYPVRQFRIFLEYLALDGLGMYQGCFGAKHYQRSLNVPDVTGCDKGYYRSSPLLELFSLLLQLPLVKR